MIKKAALISIGEEDQIFPQLPAFEKNKIICKKLYPPKASVGNFSQELSAINKICNDTSVTVFIVDGNNASDLSCMKILAEYYSKNNADFIVVVCRFAKKQDNNELLRYICQKANGIYLIEDNYTYWQLAIYVCTAIDAFVLHTKSPDMKAEMFEDLHTVFPRQSNHILDIIVTSSGENSENDVVEKFLANEANVQKIMSGHTGYCLIKPAKFQKVAELKSLHMKLSKYNEHTRPFLTIFQRGGETNVSTMFMVITRKADRLFE